MAEWLCSGLQIRERRFDSDLSLQKKMNILLTGCAGFIGYHLSRRLLQNNKVYGLDNLNDYYEVKLKKDRLSELQQSNNFSFFNEDLKNTISCFEDIHFDIAINLAAQAGVRLSHDSNYRYLDSNIIGFHNFMDYCVAKNISKVIIASSSSVYGNSCLSPFKETEENLIPASIYASTKLYNENISKIYSDKYNISLAALRFFTVYGGFGRPDMAYYSFCKDLYSQRKFTVFNEGKMSRDMTHVDDIVLGIQKAIAFVMEFNSSNFEIFNLGNANPISTLDLINKLEVITDKKAIFHFQESLSESSITHADLNKSKNILNYFPKILLDDGLKEFHDWFVSYHDI